MFTREGVLREQTKLQSKKYMDQPELIRPILG